MLFIESVSDLRFVLRKEGEGLSQIRVVFVKGGCQLTQIPLLAGFDQFADLLSAWSDFVPNSCLNGSQFTRFVVHPAFFDKLIDLCQI